MQYSQKQKMSEFKKFNGKDDLDHILKLHNSCLPEKCCSVDAIRSLLNSIDTHAIYNENGFCIFRIAANEAEIISLGVIEKGRRQGQGKKILCNVTDFLLAENIKKVFLEVENENEIAIKLYEKNGFKQTGVRKDYYKKECGEFADAKIMTRLL